MGLIYNIKRHVKEARKREAIDLEAAEILAKLNADAEEMSHDERVKKLLNDIDQAFFQNEVSSISIKSEEGRARLYKNSITAYYVQPKPKPAQVKWSKPEPPKTIDPCCIRFEDYGLYFNGADACTLLYILYCRYHNMSPKYMLDYGKMGTIEQAIDLVASSHHKDDWQDRVDLYFAIDELFFNNQS